MKKHERRVMKGSCGKLLSVTRIREKWMGQFYIHTPEYKTVIRVTVGAQRHKVICKVSTLIVNWKVLLVLLR